MSDETIHRISGYAILGLSLFELLLVAGATVLTAFGRFHPAPGGDEGTAAHLFQLAFVLLLPAGAIFLVTADWHHPSKVAKRLIVPGIALIAAFSTLYYLEHLR